MQASTGVEYYLEKIKTAIDAVDKGYQEMTIFNHNRKPLVKFFERNWCYEFYRQLRNGGENNINAEVPKASREPMEEKFCPDFIIHKQGNNDENLLVIEVKIHKKNNYKEIAKDFSTLIKMTHGNYCYKLGVWILINNDLNYVKKHVFKSKFLKKELEKKFDKEKIFVFTKDEEGKVEFDNLSNLIDIWLNKYIKA